MKPEIVWMAWNETLGFVLRMTAIGPVKIWDYETELLAKATGWHKTNPTRGQVLTLMRVFEEGK